MSMQTCKMDLQLGQMSKNLRLFLSGRQKKSASYVNMLNLGEGFIHSALNRKK